MTVQVVLDRPTTVPVTVPFTLDGMLEKTLALYAELAAAPAPPR